VRASPPFSTNVTLWPRKAATLNLPSAFKIVGKAIFNDEGEIRSKDFFYTPYDFQEKSHPPFQVSSIAVVALVPNVSSGTNGVMGRAAIVRSTRQKTILIHFGVKVTKEPAPR
jgi:hypothetical protein